MKFLGIIENQHNNTNVTLSRNGAHKNLDMIKGEQEIARLLLSKVEIQGILMVDSHGQVISYHSKDSFLNNSGLLYMTLFF